MNQVSAPFADGESLAFPHVGGRRYVRGLDVVAMIERRYPDFNRLDMKFLRPIASGARLSFRREPLTAIAISLEPRGGGPLNLYIVNLENAATPTQNEYQLAAHVALPGGGACHRYLLFGRHSHAAILAVVFNRYQAAAGQRFVLRTLHLERPRASIIELVSLSEPRIEHGLLTCSITRQGRPWCRIEMIDAEATG